MKALYFGTYDREHPRNVNAIAAMRDAGVEVVERSAPVRRRRAARSAQRLRRGDASCSSPRRREFDVVIVGYPGPLRRSARAAGRGQAAARVRRGALARGRARRRAASIPAALDRGDRAARRRPARAAAARPRRLRHRHRGRVPRVARCANVASVFLGADEELYRRDVVADLSVHRAPLRRRPPRDGRRRRPDAASYHDVPRADRRARRDRPERPRHRRRPRRHRARQLPRVARDPARRLRRARNRRAGDHGRHGRRARAAARRRVGTARRRRTIPRRSRMRSDGSPGTRSCDRDSRRRGPRRCSPSGDARPCSAPLARRCVVPALIVGRSAARDGFTGAAGVVVVVVVVVVAVRRRCVVLHRVPSRPSYER